MTERVEPEVGRIIPNVFLLAHQQRTGKTKTTVDAAQVLYERGEIDRVFVITLNTSKSVWWDRKLGGLSENRWDGIPMEVFWVHSKVRRWAEEVVEGERRMTWLITNYDFVRTKDKEKFKHLLRICGPRTLLVLDESSAVGHYRSQQSRAVQKIRAQCGWVWELNGTPTSGPLEKVYGQCLVLSPLILGYRNHMEFLNHHAKLGGPRNNWVTGWRNELVIQQKMAPYVDRVLKKDCLDLPPKLPPVTLTATLSPAAWAAYKELRDEFVVWLSEVKAVTAPQAGVRLMRMSQLTSGYLAGIKEAVECTPCPGIDCKRCDGSGVAMQGHPPQEVDRAKLNVMLDWLRDAMEEDPNLKVIVWCRFELELERVVREVRALGVPVWTMRGRQTKDERQEAIEAFHPKTAVPGPGVLVGMPSAGAKAFNFAAASVNFYLSTPYQEQREQADDRAHSPGQVNPVYTFDVVAEGPGGQKTVDHLILSALRDGKSMSDMITSAWVTQLRGGEGGE